MRTQRRAPICAATILAIAGAAVGDQLTVPSPEYPTIGAAVAAASGGDEILLLDSEFTGQANWNLSITEPITIRSASGDPASVVWLGPEGAGFPLPEDRAMIINAPVTIDGVTFRRFAGDVGGAILVQGGALTVDTCRFESNYNGDEFGCQDRLGGAIAALGADLTLLDTSFVRNSSSHPACSGTGTANGGAVYVRGGALTVERCRFEGNRANGNFSGAGGAIATRDAPTTIRDSTFLGNRATAEFARGGAVAVRGGTLAMAGVLLEGNSVDAFEEASGGGLDASGPAVLVGVELVDNLVDGLTASSGGGARLAGGLEAANLVVTGNRATHSSGCEPTFGAEAVGGGLSIGGDATLAHATLTGNTADCRGGDVVVADGGSLILRNTIVRGDIDAAGIDASYSNVTGGLPGEGNIDAEPLYQPGTFRLASGSPGVDAGSVALIPADALDLDGDGDTTEPLPLDLDGAARRADDPATADTGAGPAPIPDMGAYELGAPCPADFDGDGELTLFDFLAFQNAFDAGDPRADFDGDGELTLFDFLAFQNAFDAGC
ncbi:MAG: GC-type dockerin domain-anchored protein [Phycisphaerales bacterium JB060]